MYIIVDFASEYLPGTFYLRGFLQLVWSQDRANSRRALTVRHALFRRCTVSETGRERTRTLCIDRGCFFRALELLLIVVDASTRFALPLRDGMTPPSNVTGACSSCSRVCSCVCVTTQDLHRGQLRRSDRHGGIAQEVLQSRVGGPVRPNAGLQVRCRFTCLFFFGGFAFVKEKQKKWVRQ